MSRVPSLTSLGVLLLFVVVIRALPSVVRPTTPPDDCDAVAVSAEAMERCIAIRPKDIELMMDLAALYQRTGQTGRAVALYARAVAIDPRDAELRIAFERLRASAVSP
jgi:cytochrome c-type biogenesis protein CcmH/NrfG